MQYDILIERMKQTEETLLLELLEISSEDIIERFQDRIEEKYNYLNRQYEEEVSY